MGRHGAGAQPMSSAGEFRRPRRLLDNPPVPRFKLSGAIALHLRLGALGGVTLVDQGVRMMFPKGDGYGARIFQMLTAEYANADNDNRRRPVSL